MYTERRVLGVLWFANVDYHSDEPVQTQPTPAESHTHPLSVQRIAFNLIFQLSTDIQYIKCKLTAINHIQIVHCIGKQK